MSQTPCCPKCGKPLPADAPAGLCPKCLILAGWESQPQIGPAATVSSPSSARFEPPSVAELAGRFPQLEILELVGQGGMGAIYRARQLGLDRIVAVKILPPEVGRDASFAERFTREARALARLSHPNIVAIHDFGQTSGLFYFVMEFIDGANLREAMRAGQLEPSQALSIVPQICDALQYAHDEGVVHRDNKPENILLDKRGRVKIADFGLSKLVVGGVSAAPEFSLTGTHQVMGTVRYMAPEQLEGAKAVDHRADIYSLGVVFYEMLTGELPLGRFQPPSQKVHVDVRLDEVVLRALEKEPQRRYQQASDVKTAVQSIGQAPGKFAPSKRVYAGHDAIQVGEPSTQAAAYPVAQIPNWYATGVILLWLVGWTIAAALWNFREIGLTLAAIVMAAIGIAVVRSSLSFAPAILDEQRRASGLLRYANPVAALVMFALGFLAIVAAHGAIWDRQPMRGASGQDPSSFAARYQGKEHHLIRTLAAFREEIPRVELNMQAANFEMPWLSALWLGFSGCLLVVGAAAALIDAPKFRRSWALNWRLILAHAGLFLSALALALMVTCGASMFVIERKPDGSLFFGSGGTWNSVYRQVTCSASSDQVSEAIQAWLEANDYRTTYRSEWKVDTVPAGKTVAFVRVLGAGKASRFDALRMTWLGPRRVAPYLDIQFVSSASSEESIVTIDAGPARAGSGEAECWTPYLDSLQRALNQKFPPSAPAEAGANISLVAQADDEAT